MTSELGELAVAKELLQICAIVEFVDGKVSRETRYYAPPLEVERP